MANPANVGISLTTDTMIQSVDLEKKLSEVIKKGSTGEFVLGNFYDPLLTANVKMIGTASEAGEVAGAALAMTVTGLSGVSLVKDVSTSTKNDDYPETSFSVECAPSAS